MLQFGRRGVLIVMITAYSELDTSVTQRTLSLISGGQPGLPVRGDERDEDAHGFSGSGKSNTYIYMADKCERDVCGRR